jgi:tetratricopeptide (TPR) repeat protein
LLGAFLVALVLVAYLPALRGGFNWDDDAYVTNNLTLRSVLGLSQIWGQLTATPQYYPLVYTSFWLEYRLWGLNPLGYHAVNVLLHTLAAILLWRVLVRLQLPGAWLAAGIFALHPVAVESVAWVTERKNVLSAVFYFAAALAYLRWQDYGTTDYGTTDHGTTTRQRGSGVLGLIPSSRRSVVLYLLSLALFICALFSKTVTASLPAGLLLVIWWKHGRIAGRDVWPLVPFFVAGAASGLVTSWLERTHVGASGPEWALSFVDRCLIAGRALWLYAGKLFWPANLTFIYPRWQIDPGIWWQWLFPAAALAVVMILWTLRMRVGRGPLVAVLFFAGTLFPALGFVNVYPMRYSFVADHFQYLASAGLIVLATAGLTKIFRPVPFAAVLLPLVLAVLTWKQSAIYADQKTLWQDTLAKNPASWMAHNNLGTVLESEGQIDEAIGHYEEALRLKPDHAEAHNNLGNTFYKKGRTDDALHEYREAIRLKPDYAIAYGNLGTALGAKGRNDEAIKQFHESIRLNSLDGRAHYNFGIVLFKNNQADDAIMEFQHAVRLLPDYANARINLGIALGSAGRLDEAIAQFREAVRLRPDFAEARSDLGVALLKQGQIDEAINQFQEAVRLKPDDPATRNNLTRALEVKKNPAPRRLRADSKN